MRETQKGVEKLSEKMLAEIYFKARRLVELFGFEDEIVWQESRCLEGLSEREFLGEAAWVILSSGMKEAVVRKVYGRISAAFRNWESADAIIASKAQCRRKALSAFSHKGKINAILCVADYVSKEGFSKVSDEIRNGGISYLEQFPYIGPITRYHLAKNLGLEVVKPDRHLTRIARAARYDSPHELCSAIAKQTGEKLSVVDLVLWRFATCERRYVDLFQVSG